MEEREDWREEEEKSRRMRLHRRPPPSRLTSSAASISGEASSGEARKTCAGGCGRGARRGGPAQGGGGRGARRGGPAPGTAAVVHGGADPKLREMEEIERGMEGEGEEAPCEAPLASPAVSRPCLLPCLSPARRARGGEADLHKGRRAWCSGEADLHSWAAGGPASRSGEVDLHMGVASAVLGWVRSMAFVRSEGESPSAHIPSLHDAELEQQQLRC